MDLTEKRILVAGGAGFLGLYVVKKLQERGCKKIFIPRRTEYDLTREAAVEHLYSDVRPHLVIHLAAVVGGIGANQVNPGRFANENLVMGALLMEYARRARVEKFICLGTICTYPKFAPVPFREEDLWNGYPEETNAPYGLAKKMLLVLGQAYQEQYGFNTVYLLPVNLYGPGDHFDLESSHVIPALIRKCIEPVEDGRDEVVCWGDGSPTREFLYVEDCAEAIILATEGYEGADPINLGTGFEISIKNWVGMIAELCGFQGKVIWDTSKPNGQPRRQLDIQRAWERFGFRAQTDFRKGLRRTIKWYKEESGRAGAATSLGRR